MNFSEIKNSIRYSKRINFCRKTVKSISFLGFEGMSIYEGVKFTIEAFMRSDILTKSAAISFRFFIALFPTVILILSLIPYVPIQDFQNNLLKSITDILPDSLDTMISHTIEDLILKKHKGVLSIGFILTLYYASSIISSVLNTFSSSYQIEVKRNPIKLRLIGLFLMIGITIMMLTGFTLILFSENYISYLMEEYQIDNWLITTSLNLLKWVAVIILFILSISTLYNVAHTERRKWKVLSAGASWTTGLIILTSLGLNFYINNFDSYNRLYGSIGSLIVFLLWINISSTILIVGFELYAKTNSLDDKGFE